MGGLDAITKYFGWGVSTSDMHSSQEAGESQIKVPADSESGEGSPPGLHTATFSLCPCRAGGESFGLHSSSHRDTNAITGAPRERPHLTLIRASTYKLFGGWVGNTNIQALIGKEKEDRAIS